MTIKQVLWTVAKPIGYLFLTVGVIALLLAIGGILSVMEPGFGENGGGALVAILGFGGVSSLIVGGLLCG